MGLHLNLNCFLLLENNSVHWVAKQKQFISDHYRVENFKIKVPGDWFQLWCALKTGTFLLCPYKLEEEKLLFWFPVNTAAVCTWPASQGYIQR